MKIVLIGSSSDIAQKLVADKRNEYEFIEVSSSNSDFDVQNEESYPEIEGGIDGLVYFPGSINLRPFSSLKLSDFQKDYEINVLGLIKILKHYHKALNENASLVFISSIAASVGMPFHSSISTSKAAIEGLCRSLAAEWSPTVRVNCVAPSLVNTKLSKRMFRTETQTEQMKDRHPLKQVGSTQDISNAISFLLSADSAWVTGQVFGVDGGLSTIKK
jgi:NAD(P)-dependent dehydrogenase (short-subunit alcohol dehydrogenase family)